MVDVINISEKEYKDMIDFYNKKIDHVFIKSYDESKPIMICHGRNGKLIFNGQAKFLKDIKEDVKKELNNNSKHFYLEIACCYGKQLKSEINKNEKIIPKYKIKGTLYYKYNKNILIFSDYFIKPNEIKYILENNKV